MRPLLEVENAAFRYAGTRRAIGPFSLQVRPGELHLVRGPSGSGKTTLARMLAATIPHLYRGELSGAVRVDGDVTTLLPLWQVSERVGLVAQNPAAQLLGASVAEEVGFGLETLGLPRDEVNARRDQALRWFGLERVVSRDPQTLSGGEQQLLLLAALVARRPRALILDEPCAMLDAVGRARVLAACAQLRRDGMALVISEHARRAYPLPIDREHLLAAPGAIAQRPLPAWPHRLAPFEVAVRSLGVRLGARCVLDDVDLTLRGGKVLALTGRNGAGKTTLLRCLAGLQPYSGRIAVHGAASTLRWGMSFQNPDRQFFNPSARAEIEFGRRSSALPSPALLIELLGLTAVADGAPLLLSEGEKKRLALGVILAAPELAAVCLDEPTIGQDDAHRQNGRLVRHLAAHGMLCIVATHDLEWSAEWADEISLLHDGKIAATLPARELWARRDAWVEAGLLPAAPAESGPAHESGVTNGNTHREEPRCLDAIGLY